MATSQIAPESQQSTACPKGALVACHDGARRIVPAPCGRWQCKNCGWRLAQKLATRIGLTRIDRFVTLTLRANDWDATIHQLDFINASWRSLYKRIKRKFPNEELGYVKVVEFTKVGTPHLHIALQSPFLSQRWLSRNWRELTGSHIVDIRKITSQRSVARYLSKYLTKSTVTVAHRRKYAASRRFLPQLPDVDEDVDSIRPDWHWTPARVDRARLSLLSQGWREVGDWLVEPAAEIAARASSVRLREQFPGQWPEAPPRMHPLRVLAGDSPPRTPVTPS